MSQIHAHYSSFNSGELSPLMGSRMGVEKVASGCRKLRNFLLHVHGPVFRRPGMEYLGNAASAASRSRLHPFQFSTTTSAVLELHPTGMRVWQNGALVPLLNPVALPYSEAECAEVQMAQVNDVVYLAHPSHAPRKLSRVADDDWRIGEVPWKWPAMGDPSVVTTDLPPTATALVNSPAPAVTEFSVTTTAPTSNIVFVVTNPDLSSATKIITVQRLSGGAWVAAGSRTWTTSAPAAFLGALGGPATYTVRVSYSGPQAPSGGNVTGTIGGIGTVVTLMLDSMGPYNQATVPAGEWRASLVCPASVSGVAVYVERLDGASWTTLHTFSLSAGAALTYDGATLVAPKQIRLRWTGPFEANGFTGKIEQLVYPPAVDVTITPSHTTGSARTLTASAGIFHPQHVGSFWQIGHRRTLASVSLVGASAPTLEAATSSSLFVSGKWQVLTYGLWTSVLYLERKRGATWEIVRSWEGNSDRNIIAEGEEDQIVEMRIRIDAGTWAAVSGGAAAPRFVLEALDPEIYGLVKIQSVGTLGANGKSTTATADIISPLHSTAATPVWEEGAWSTLRGFPRTVAIHGERLWFGGTKAEPMRLWGSVVADYEDFRRSTFDDAGVSFTPAASSSHPIQWLFSRDRELMIGTAGDEWSLSTESGPITPTNVLVQRRSAHGSEYAPALLIGENVVFVQRNARKLRAIAPRAETEAWAANDLTVLAEHVTQSGVAQMAMQSSPFTVLWVVTNDGRLLGMTFEQEQNVFGWHVHETDGAVESVAVIRGPDVDEVWLSVRRGSSRFIERLDALVATQDFARWQEMIYLDAAKRFSSVGPSVTGLSHLNGRSVVTLKDGVPLAAQTVSGGAINIGSAATHVVVGLPFTSTLQPMRTDIPLSDGTAIGRSLRATRTRLLLHESRGGEVADAPAEAWQAVPYPAGAAPFSGDAECVLSARHRESIDVIVRQTAPLPFNLGSLVVKADVYGE